MNDELLNPDFPRSGIRAYDRDTVRLLVKATQLSLRHPDDPFALDAEELRHIVIPSAPGGYDYDYVDDWLDDIIPVLERCVRR